MPGAPLFQASGWVEPNPFAVRVTALTEGIVEEMLVEDFRHCSEMSIADIENRSVLFRLATRIARLFSPVL